MHKSMEEEIALPSGTYKAPIGKYIVLILDTFSAEELEKKARVFDTPEDARRHKDELSPKRGSETPSLYGVHALDDQGNEI